MKTLLKFLLMIAIMFTISSCEDLQKVVSQTGKPPVGISNADNIAGLKNSLTLGIEGAVGLL